MLASSGMAGARLPVHDAMVVEAKDTGDRVAHIGRQHDRAGARVKIAELGMTVVEQLDAEGVADIGDGAANPEPRRGRLVPGHSQMMSGGELLDLVDRGGVRPVFVAQLVAGHIFALARALGVEGGEVGERFEPAHTDRQLDPAVGIGSPFGHRTRRQMMQAVGEHAPIGGRAPHRDTP